MGGDCLTVGCVPSKGMIRAARAWATIPRGKEFGLEFPSDVRRDFGEAMARMRRLRAQISHTDSAQRFTSLGVDVFIGEGHFTGPDTVDVGGTILRFSRAAVCTGARAAALPIPGLEDAGYLTNETVFSLTRLPARLAVIGAGPIGCEFGAVVRPFREPGHATGADRPHSSSRGPGRGGHRAVAHARGRSRPGVRRSDHRGRPSRC